MKVVDDSTTVAEYRYDALAAGLGRPTKPENSILSPEFQGRLVGRIGVHMPDAAHQKTEGEQKYEKEYCIDAQVKLDVVSLKAVFHHEWTKRQGRQRIPMHDTTLYDWTPPEGEAWSFSQRYNSCDGEGWTEAAKIEAETDGKKPTIDAGRQNTRDVTQYWTYSATFGKLSVKGVVKKKWSLVKQE